MRVAFLTSATILTVFWIFQKHAVVGEQELTIKRGFDTRQTVEIVTTIFEEHGFLLTNELNQQFSTTAPAETGKMIDDKLRQSGLESYWSTDQNLRVYSNEKLEYVVRFVNNASKRLLNNNTAFLILCKGDHKQPHHAADSITSIAISPLAAFSFIQAKQAAKHFNEVYLWVDQNSPPITTSALPYSSGQILSKNGKLSILSKDKIKEFAHLGKHPVEKEIGTLIVLSELTLRHDEIDKKLQEHTLSRVYLSEWLHH